MKLRFLLATLALAALGACGDSAAPPRPARLKVVAGDAQSGTVGQSLVVAPTFTVEDERGAPMTGVAVRISVVGGGGVLTEAPNQTTGATTRVGVWRLGSKVGANELKVEVPGVATASITATAVAGAAAKLTPEATGAVGGRVGENVRLPTVLVTDALDNPLAGAAVTVVVAGGGSAATALTADATGRVDVGNWTLGTVAGEQTLTLKAGSATVVFNATASAGDPAQLVAVSGDAQRALAGTIPPQPIVVRVTDRFGNGVANVDATAAVIAGGGSLGTTVAHSAADGAITVSSWTLGRSAVPQSVRVTAGALTADVAASIKTDYNIEVRFFGPPMTPAQQAIFTTAAARLSAIVTGDLPEAPVFDLDLGALCGIAGMPHLTETIDDLVIYASVRPIDGPRGILARAGPCVSRPFPQGFLSVVGVMDFDEADIALMTQQGTLQDVITHEMLHVLGVGTLWWVRGLVLEQGTPNVAFYGTEGTHGCVTSGGTAICQSNVPVENIGGAGTADSHWREATFRNELMTGFVNLGGMPLSQITVGSLADIGYTVNPFAADPFQIPSPTAASAATIGGEPWEQPLPIPVVLDGKGNAQPIKRP